MSTVTLQPSGLAFTVEANETVLEAGLRQGFVLPYGCRNGACGSCKAKLVAGSVDYGKYAHKALPDEERAAGKVLLCQARPQGDLVIEARTIGAARDIPVRTLPCRVQSIERPVGDVAVLKLKLPANERLQFLAGQYLEFILRDGRRRSYSMANPPHAEEFVELHIRHTPGGAFTDHVFGKLKERDILRFEAPLGSFFLREDSARPMVLLASGTGFAPIKAIVEHTLEKGFTRPMTLYWGGRRPHDLYMHALAESWAAANPRLRYVPVVSDALPEDAWRGRTGFVHRAVMEDFPDLSGHQVYACGAPVVIDAARRDFTTVCRLPEDEFFADSFTTAADLAAAG